MMSVELSRTSRGDTERRARAQTRPRAGAPPTDFNFVTWPHVADPCARDSGRVPACLWPAPGRSVRRFFL